MTEAATATVAGPDGTQVWRRLRLPVLGLLAVCAVAVLVALAQSRTVKGELDPRAVDGPGSRALAALLADRGVEVRRVTSVADAVASVAPKTTVFVPFPDRVPADQLATLADAQGGGPLVLVAPRATQLDAVGSRIAAAGGTAEVLVRTPSCDLPAADTAGDVDLGGRTYRPGSAVGCYPAGDGVTLVAGQHRGGGSLYVVGSRDPFTNERLDQRGNAALSLELLGADGSSDRVVWLMSIPGSAASSGMASLTDILPPWTVVASVQLLLGCLVVARWRGGRLGPPVVEPLPVVVRAAETVEGRARMYRRAGARDRAAEALRVGALARLLPRLRLGSEPSHGAIVSEVARRASRSEHDVGSLLFGPPPIDDPALVRLADELDSIVTITLKTPKA